MVIPEKACPVLRYGGRNPEERGGKTAASLTLVKSDYPYVTLAKARARIHL